MIKIVQGDERRAIRQLSGIFSGMYGRLTPLSDKAYLHLKEKRYDQTDTTRDRAP